MNVNSLSNLKTSAKLPAQKLQDNTATMVQAQENKPAQAGKISENRIQEAVKVANNIMKMVDTRIEYSVDKNTNLDIIKVIDKESGKVIKQYPPEEIVNMLTRMYDMLGFFVDKTI